MVKDDSEIEKKLDNVIELMEPKKRTAKTPSFLGINDDVIVEEILPNIDRILTRFFHTMWPNPSPWEVGT